MRVPRSMLGVQADIAHQLQNAVLPLLLAGIELVYVQRLADDIGDRHARVQRGIRILEDHGCLAAEGLNVGLGADGLAVVDDLAGRGLVEVQDGAADRRLAAAGFTDQTERFARMDGEADVIDGLQGLGAQKTHIDVEVLLQVAYLNDRLSSFVFHASAPSFCSGFSASDSAMLPSSTPSLTFIQQEAR